VTRTRRLFFALWPDAQVRDAFARATHKAVRACGGRPVEVENLHATLLFLGSVAESRIPDLVAVAADALSATDVLTAARMKQGLIFDRIEYWPKSHILVAATSTSASPGHALAAALWAVLDKGMRGLGLEPDLKPFRAHVTLARKVARLGRALDMRPVSWSLEGFALVESRTMPEGSQYSVLQSFALVSN
jgi:2'-5' RNA ligase